MFDSRSLKAATYSSKIVSESSAKQSSKLLGSIGKSSDHGNIDVQVIQISLINRRLDFISNLLVCEQKKKKDQSYLEKAGEFIQGAVEGVFFHQAILIVSCITNDKDNDRKQYHICEYVSDNGGQVELSVQEYKKDTQSGFKFQNQSYSWSKDNENLTPTQCTVRQVYEQMNQIAGKRNYDLYEHNCRHVAMETYKKFRKQ